jgi:hypothetical protein
MSRSKFAAITSGLLARKGEARPWADPDMLPLKQPLAWRSAETGSPPPQHQTPQPKTHQHETLQPKSGAEKRAAWKKYVLRLSHYDYERLGILAVKQGKTRQRLLQESVDQLFGGMTQAYGGNCACLSAQYPEKCGTA